MKETLTQTIARAKLPNETMTQTLHRLKQEGESITQTAGRLAREGDIVEVQIVQDEPILTVEEAPEVIETSVDTNVDTDVGEELTPAQKAAITRAKNKAAKEAEENKDN